MNKEILKKILKTESVCFSYEEIQNMLDEELEKSPDEMDTEFVDLCVEVLNKCDTETKEEKTKVKKFSPKKVLLIVAVLVTIAVLALPVGAKVFRIEAAEDIIRVFEDYIQIDFSKGEKYDLSRELHNYKLNDSFIPGEFYKSNCIITDSAQIDENNYSFCFEFNDANLNGYINITVFDELTNNMNEIQYIYSDIELLKQIVVNGVDIIIYSSVPGHIDVLYLIDNICYRIFFESGTFDEVTKIIENF